MKATEDKVLARVGVIVGAVAAGVPELARVVVDAVHGRATERAEQVLWDQVYAGVLQMQTARWLQASNDERATFKPAQIAQETADGAIRRRRASRDRNFAEIAPPAA